MATKTDRIMTMLSLVPRHPSKISTDRLQGYLSDAGFPVTQRTVQRDLQELSVNHPIVLDERSKPYGWSYMAGYNSRGTSMGPFEALAFVIASREYSGRLPSGIAQYLAPLEAEARSTLEAYSSSLATFEKKVARIPQGFSLIPAEIVNGVLDAVYDGLLREKILVVDYATLGEFEFKPLGLAFRDQVTYLVGTFWKYKDIRQLALHRVSSCSVTEAGFSIPKNFSLQQYDESGAFGYVNSEASINLELKMTTAAARHLRETPLSRDQTISSSSNGWVEIVANVNDRKDLVWWILGFGDQIEVISPTRIRDRVCKILSRAMKNYER